MKNIIKTETLDGFLTERVDVHENSLLGFIDEAGDYFIPEKVREELVKLKKVKKSTFDNNMYCVSNCIGLGELLFQVEYANKSRRGVASCNIYLLENIYKVNGYYSNTIKTLLETLKAPVKDFLNTSYSKFNIVLDDDDDDDGGRDDMVEDSVLFSYMLSKKQYENALFRKVKDDVDKVYDKLFAAKLDILKKQNTPFAKEVLEEYEQEVKLIKDRFLTAKGDDNRKAESELLDKVIEDNLGEKEGNKEAEDNYINKVAKEIEKANKEFNKIETSAEKSVKKDMSREDWEKFEDLGDSLKERNKDVEKDISYGKSAKIAESDVNFEEQVKSDVEKDKEDAILTKLSEKEEIKEVKQSEKSDMLGIKEQQSSIKQDVSKAVSDKEEKEKVSKEQVNNNLTARVNALSGALAREKEDHAKEVASLQRSQEALMQEVSDVKAINEELKAENEEFQDRYDRDKFILRGAAKFFASRIMDKLDAKPDMDHSRGRDLRNGPPTPPPMDRPSPERPISDKADKSVTDFLSDDRNFRITKRGGRVSSNVDEMDLNR